MITLKKNFSLFLLETTSSVFVKALGSFSSLLLTFIVSNNYSSSDAGNYFLAITYIMIMSAIGRVGMDNTVIKFAGSQPSSKIEILFKSLLLISPTCLLLSILTYFMSDYISSSIFSKPELSALLKILSPCIFFTGVLTIASNIIQAIKYVKLSIITINILTNTLVVSSVILLNEIDLVSMVKLQSFFFCIVALLALFLVICLRVDDSNDIGTHISIYNLLNSSMPLWVVIIMTQLVQWSGQLVAGIFLSASEVAVLVICQRTALITSFTLITVNLVVAPRFSRLFSSGKLRDLHILSKQSVIITTSMAIPIFLGFIFFPEKILSYFGNEYTYGAKYLTVISFGQFVSAITGSVTFLLIMTGHERDMRNITIISGLSALIFTYSLTALFGALGNSIGTAFGVILQNLLAVFFVRKRLGFNTLIFWK